MSEIYCDWCSDGNVVRIKLLAFLFPFPCFFTHSCWHGSFSLYFCRLVRGPKLRLESRTRMFSGMIQQWVTWWCNSERSHITEWWFWVQLCSFSPNYNHLLVCISENKNKGVGKLILYYEKCLLMTVRDMFQMLYMGMEVNVLCVGDYWSTT